MCSLFNLLIFYQYDTLSGNGEKTLNRNILDLGNLMKVNSADRAGFVRISDGIVILLNRPTFF